jgi:hypothetical protein
MSIQSENKEKQGYVPKPEFPMCSNCAHFKSDMVATGYGGYMAEKNIRCGVGEFAVKKNGTCNYHTRNLIPHTHK